MASYGQAHTSDKNLLKSKGLFLQVVDDPCGTRFISPLEHLLAMGINQDCVLSSDRKVAHKHVGSSIALPHQTQGH